MSDSVEVVFCAARAGAPLHPHAPGTVHSKATVEALAAALGGWVQTDGDGVVSAWARRRVRIETDATPMSMVGVKLPDLSPSRVDVWARVRAPKELEVSSAARAWGFNCGPAVLCVVLGVPAEQVRTLLGPGWPGYTTPAMMRETLHAGRGEYPDVVDQRPDTVALLPSESFELLDRVALDHGTTVPLVVRIQWGGTWTAPTVPAAARYERTHWIAVARPPGPGCTMVYDVNATEAGGWLPLSLWVEHVVPAVLRHVPRADGSWWPTHIWRSP